MSFTIHRGIEDVEGEEMSEFAEFVNDYNETETLYLQEAREEAIREARRHLEGFNQQEDTPVKKDFFDIIMSKVIAIQKKYPKRLLCGSVALMLYGVIEKRDGGDIDFVAFEDKIVPNEHLSLQCKSPYKHCLFLGSYVKKGSTIDGIKLQDLGQIIFWKRTYGRKKDIKDLKNYLDNQFIKEGEFII